MSQIEIHAVTGAFGYSGKYIARNLLDKGHRVITLTSSIDRQDPFEGQVKAYPFNFEEPEKLEATLKGVSVLYNTYWVRFNYGSFRHSQAIRNTKILFEAAGRAGVRRIVHISITNPSENSPFEYFMGKAILENDLKKSGLSHAILRPAVIFGKEDILINNIAWLLRHFPAFGIFGDGNYRLQPIYVEDLAKIAVTAGESDDNVIINCIGPETFTYRNLVETMGTALGKKRPVISISPKMGLFIAKIIGIIMGDVLITREEIDGLMSDLLYVDVKPSGWTKLTEWLLSNADTLGKHYANELIRRENRQKSLK
jgi:uncharacterized protein YbjT (DUF2867 family)